MVPPPVSALRQLLRQNVEGHLVGLTVEVLEQGVFEEGVVGAFLDCKPDTPTRQAVTPFWTTCQCD